MTRGAEQQESPHVDWLPAQTRNPLGMASHSIANGLSRLRIPYSNVSVVSTGSEFPLPRLPLDAENPPLVPREDVGGRFGVKIPQSGVRISRPRGEQVPGRGKCSAEDGRAVACKKARVLNMREKRGTLDTKKAYLITWRSILLPVGRGRQLEVNSGQRKRLLQSRGA